MDFTVEGNPGAIRSRAQSLRTQGQLFFDTGDALASIDTEGWIGRASEEFREAHDLEPERWTKAGNGFLKAADALLVYADQLEDAQARAAEAEAEHDRGNRETTAAEGRYASYMSQMRTYWAQGGTDPAEPYVDSGAAIRDGARNAMQAVRRDLDAAASTCAGQVRAGCADAPEEPKWWESGLRFVGGIFQGAGEAIWGIVTLGDFNTIDMLWDAWQVASGDMTAEEWARKQQLSGEEAWDMAGAMYTAATTDPLEFGKNLGKSLLDWDTWADDPARAIGHLVPDALAAVFTGGAGAVATRGTKIGVDLLDGLADLAKFRHLDNVDDLGNLRRLDDGAPRSMFEHDATPDSYRSREDQLNEPSYSSDNRSIVDGDYEIFGRDSNGNPLTRDQFENQYVKPDGDWNWPSNDGKVPGSEEIVRPGDVPRMDRIGGPDGSYFADDGAPMSDRALPPDRLNFDRNQWEINRDHPDLADGSVQIERSEVAPAFGQEGGGNQYRFLDADGNALSQRELAERGIIDSPYRFDAGDAAAGAGVTHGAQSADRMADQYDDSRGPR